MYVYILWIPLTATRGTFIKFGARTNDTIDCRIKWEVHCVFFYFIIFIFWGLFSINVMNYNQCCSFRVKMNPTNVLVSCWIQCWQWIFNFCFSSFLNQDADNWFLNRVMHWITLEISRVYVYLEILAPLLLLQFASSHIRSLASFLPSATVMMIYIRHFFLTPWISRSFSSLFASIYTLPLHSLHTHLHKVSMHMCICIYAR